MVFYNYQNGAYALGIIDVDVDPYHLNISQNGIYVLGYNGPVALSYTMSGGLILSGISLNKVNYKYTSTGSLILGGDGTYNLAIIDTLNVNYVTTGSLILGGDSVETSNGTYEITINYLLTGPAFRDITTNNKYFKIEIINNAIFNDLNVLLISSDKNATFSSITPINNEDRYIEFFYFPSRVGNHYIEAICNDNGINFVGNKFKFLSTSMDSEEGLYPRIEFEVDFRLENINLDLNIINTKTFNLPGVDKVLKQGNQFTLNGKSALYVKDNYVNGVLKCLKIIN